LAAALQAFPGLWAYALTYFLDHRKAQAKEKAKPRERRRPLQRGTLEHERREAADTGSRGAKRQIRGLEGRSGRYGVCDVKQSNEVNLLKRHVRYFGFLNARDFLLSRFARRGAPAALRFGGGLEAANLP